MVFFPRILWSYEFQHRPKSQSHSHLGAKSTQLAPRCPPQQNPKVSISISDNGILYHLPVSIIKLHTGTCQEFDGNFSKFKSLQPSLVMILQSWSPLSILINSQS